MQQGPFAPRALPRFIATTDPAATVSSSADFPVSPVIRPTLLRRFLDGTRTASPVARHVLVTVLPLPPRRSDLPHQSDCDTPCCLRPNGEGSASGSCFLSRPPVGSLALRPGDSLTIPKMALSIGFISFVSSTDAIQATGLLTPTPVGLTPTEHASLSWTHSLPKTHARERGRCCILPFGGSGCCQRGLVDGRRRLSAWTSQFASSAEPIAKRLSIALHRATGELASSARQRIAGGDSVPGDLNWPCPGSRRCPRSGHRRKA